MTVLIRTYTAWPTGLPLIGDTLERFAETVAVATSGRVLVEAVDPCDAGSPNEALELMQTGDLDAIYGTPFFWVDTHPAAYAFFAMPFGMTDAELASWVFAGEGGALWTQLYSEMGLHPYLVGTMGPTPLGWFRKPLMDAEDLRGLRFRGSGVGVNALSRLGVVLADLPQSEVLAAMTRGELDGFEMVGPAFDLLKGAHTFQDRPVYYPNGFHHPSASLEFSVSNNLYARLSADNRAALGIAAQACWTMCHARMLQLNSAAMDKMQCRLGADVRQVPAALSSVLKVAAQKEVAALVEGLVPRDRALLEAAMKQATVFSSYAVSFGADYALSRI